MGHSERYNALSVYSSRVPDSARQPCRPAPIWLPTDGRCHERLLAQAPAQLRGDEALAIIRTGMSGHGPMLSAGVPMWRLRRREDPFIMRVIRILAPLALAGLLAAGCAEQGGTGTAGPSVQPPSSAADNGV